MDITNLKWYNIISTMGNKRNEIIISISDRDLPLLEDELATKRYSEKIALDATHSYTHKVDYNPKLIKLLLSNERYFQEVVDSFCNPHQCLVHLPNAMFINKCIFYNLVSKELTGLKAIGIKNLKGKLATIKSMSEVNFLPTLVPKFETTLEGKKYTIDTDILVHFLESEHKDIDYSKNDVTTIHGYPKKIFFKILQEFTTRYHIAQGFILNKDARKLLAEINTDQAVDTYAIDKITTTYDNIKLDVVLDDGLVAYAMSGIKDGYSDIQKAMHIYIKLCRALSYDPTFYAENESREVNLLHMNPNTIKNISLDSPNVVCYEFNAIYANLLKRLGINYEVKSRSKTYGDGHAYLTFRADDYIVNADSLPTIIGSDLLNAKVGQELKGISCENKNAVMRNRFLQTLQEVYLDILDSEKTKYTSDVAFKKLASMMMSLGDSNVQISNQDKLDVFTNICKTTTLPTVEKQAYLLSMFKSVFGENNGAMLTIVSTKDSDEQKFYDTGMIISIRKKPINKIGNYDYDYYEYDANTSTWNPVSKDNLQSRANKEHLHWFGTHFVPAISTPDEEAIFNSIEQIYSDKDFH